MFRLRLALVLVAVLSWPRLARADFEVDLCDTACVLLPITLVLIVPAVFGVAEAAYGSQGRWFPIGWAVPELVYGAGMSVLAGALIASPWTSESPATYVFAAAALWITTHAVLSLIYGDRGPAPPRQVAQLLRGRVDF